MKRTCTTFFGGLPSEINAGWVGMPMKSILPTIPDPQGQAFSNNIYNKAGYSCYMGGSYGNEIKF